MAGTLVEIVPMRKLDFGFLSAAGAVADLILKQRVDVSEWRAGALLVRVKLIDIPATGSITIKALAEGPTTDDPGAVFVSPIELGSVIVDDSFAAPYLDVGSLSANCGSHVRVIATGRRTSAPGNLSATLAVDLCLKNRFIELA